MKFVAMLDMERCQSAEECQTMIDEFDDYMSAHPAITNDEFKDTLTLAHQFGNKKCIAQCEFAQDKCSETRELFNKRREILIKAKQQMKKKNKFRILKKYSSSVTSSPSSSLSSETLDVDESVVSAPADHSNMVTSVEDDSSVFSMESAERRESDTTSDSLPSLDMSPIPPCLPSPITPSVNQKPARKLLKKCDSTPSTSISQKSLPFLRHHHSMTIGSPMQKEGSSSTDEKS